MVEYGATNRDRLEDEASALRAQLAKTLESLHRRRQVAVEPPVSAAPSSGSAALNWAGPLLVLAGGATGLLAYRARRRRRHLGAQRLQALARFWKHPEQLARSPRGLLGAEIAHGVAASLITFVVAKLAERVLLKALSQLRLLIAPATR